MPDARKRVLDAVNHRQPDRVPVDFGSMTSSGMHCSIVGALRDYYGLEKRPVKVHEPFQMLGYVDDDLREAMGVDSICVMPISSRFGNSTGAWKSWLTHWGQEVLVPKDMQMQTLEDGAVVVFPQGDRKAPPSAKMPGTGFFFDALERPAEYDEENPDPADNVKEFKPISDDSLARMAQAAKEARASGLATFAILPGTNLGSASTVPGMSLKRPKGVRTLVDWYMAMAAMPEFIESVFALQTEIALKNLEKIYQTIGGDYDIVLVCGSDFGTQISTFFSREVLDRLFRPFYKKINGWIHANTPWKTFKHCCGAIEPFIGALIDSGFDILNPIQCSAAGMEPEKLKKKYGDRLTFWGGGVDTQSTLPFGTPEDVRKQVLERCRIFAPGGGFVFNSVHNIQALTPLENVVAMLEAVKEFNNAGK